METGEEERETGNEVAGPDAFDVTSVSLSTLFWWFYFERWILLQKEKTTNFLRRNQGGKWNVL